MSFPFFMEISLQISMQLMCCGNKAGESQPQAPGQIFLIAINERITSELLARNRRITDKNAM
jgi:hypothetical protein